MAGAFMPIETQYKYVELKDVDKSKYDPSDEFIEIFGVKPEDIEEIKDDSLTVKKRFKKVKMQDQFLKIPSFKDLRDSAPLRGVFKNTIKGIHVDYYNLLECDATTILSKKTFLKEKLKIHLDDLTMTIREAISRTSH